MRLYGLLFIGLGVGIALVTLNAIKTGEMQGRFELFERDDSPDFFRLLVYVRFGCSAVVVVLGLIAALFDPNST